MHVPFVLSFASKKFGSGRMLSSIPLLRAAGLRPGKIRFLEQGGKALARALFDLLLKVKSRRMAQR
jgi:hypothetical protein